LVENRLQQITHAHLVADAIKVYCLHYTPSAACRFFGILPR
jgi:hypothetical protein